MNIFPICLAGQLQLPLDFGSTIVAKTYGKFSTVLVKDLFKDLFFSGESTL